MRNKEEVFKLLRESVETPQESFAVEEMISKIEGIMPPIEDVSETQKKFAGYRFYKSSTRRFACTISMHRFVWTYFNGEIPEGYEIHHRDLNPDNNDIANLQLLTKEEHKKVHAATKEKRKLEKKSTFICAVCGCEYEAVSRGNNTYCSIKCKEIAKRERAAKLLKKREIRVCIQCGREFSAPINGNQKFCSWSCVGKSHRKRETRVCLHCGKEFSARITSDRKYCSTNCFCDHRKRRETKICPICGKEFTAKATLKRKYCSRACFQEARRKNPDGE